MVPKVFFIPLDAHEVALATTPPWRTPSLGHQPTSTDGMAEELTMDGVAEVAYQIPDGSRSRRTLSVDLWATALPQNCRTWWWYPFMGTAWAPVVMETDHIASRVNGMSDSASVTPSTPWPWAPTLWRGTLPHTTSPPRACFPSMKLA